MIVTNCKSLDWMLGHAVECDKSEEHTVYHFRGRIAFRMLCEVRAWMKAQGARFADGRSRSSYTLSLENRVDAERRWYKHTSVSVSYGSYRGAETDVEVFLTVYDCLISDADLADMQQVGTQLAQEIA
jgi:hypothetical protein